jgi:hypothetical protein
VSDAVIVDGSESAPGTRGGHPIRRILLIVVFAVGAGALASLLGWDIRGWFERL